MSENVPDHPTGPADADHPATGPDAPATAPDEVHERRNRATEHQPDMPPPDGPRQDRDVSNTAEFRDTSADAVFPATSQDLRITKGSDPAAPTAGLLAAAAGTQGQLTEAEYREFCEQHPEWTPADELIETYGSSVPRSRPPASPASPDRARSAGHRHVQPQHGAARAGAQFGEIAQLVGEPQTAAVG